MKSVFREYIQDVFNTKRENLKKKVEKKKDSVLVVGSWAKEQITIENLAKNKNRKIFAYMDTRNPGIEKIVDGHKIGSFYDVAEIVNYAKRNNVDLVIPTTASPLSVGLIDAMEKEGIPAFGPSNSAARLESDKSFTRDLLKKYHINANPKFRVFKHEKNAIKYARQLNWEIAIKPIGLTEGLGVKVFGDQLKTPKEAEQYILQIFKEKIGGKSAVIIEEKLVGVEFTLQCLVNGNIVVPTPTVQDFKKLLDGEKGLNTASMGSYMCKEHILPYISKKEYRSALKIIKKTLRAFNKETNEKCMGFLYGQFMLTKSGVKLIEYNFRPGDPEWLNTMYVLQNDLFDVLNNLMNGMIPKLKFENKATVCKYIVPLGYPKELNQTLDIEFDEIKFKNSGVDFYHSCGYDEEGLLNVGTERGIAFIAKSSSIPSATVLLENAMSEIDGDFHYRQDIGTIDLLDEKIRLAENLRQSD